MKEIVMTSLDSHRYSMLVRVTEFGAAHRDRFPAAGHASRLFAAISKAVDQLGTHALAQSAGERPARGGRFRLPSIRNDHELTTAARSFARDAAHLKAPFLARGLPKTFIADLRAAVDAFERASQHRFVARARCGAARAGIRTAIDTALIALNRLDAIVLNVFRDEPAFLAGWTSAKHVTRARTRGRRTPTLTRPSATATAAPATPGGPAPLTTADAAASA